MFELPRKIPEYDDLKEVISTENLVYGPVQSRRLGLSLGVNLTGDQDKLCSFNCPYCELGLTKIKMSQIRKLMTFPPVADIEAALRSRIVQLSKENIRPEYITLSGGGEPTLHPDIAEVIQAVKSVRNELVPETKITILSNGSTLDQAKVIRALNLLDERIIKLDAGNDEMLRKINDPLVRITVSKIIQGAKKLNDVIIQAMFVQGAIDNTTALETEDWLEVVGIIRPKAVQLYTLDRIPAVSGLKQVPSQRMKELALNLQKRHIKAAVFS